MLIIGAAVIIAVIVIALMMSLSNTGTSTVEEANVSDIYHDLKVALRGYEIEVVASDNSNGYGSDDARNRCSAINGTTYCAWPINNPEEIFGPNYLTCYDTSAEVIIRIEDLETNEITTHTLNVTGINFHIGDEKEFNINYKGDPNHKHNIKALFVDCCNSSDGIQNIGCNISGSPYIYDKNMKILSVAIVNSDGQEVGNESGHDCYRSSMTAPCYDLNFQ